MEDKLLVLRCKRGRADALGRIYEKYKKDTKILSSWRLPCSTTRVPPKTWYTMSSFHL
jgi:hypothetical protein